MSTENFEAAELVIARPNGDCRVQGEEWDLNRRQQRKRRNCEGGEMEISLTLWRSWFVFGFSLLVVSRLVFVLV